MPIRTMLKRASSMPSSRASTRTCPAISPGGQVAIDPHLARQAERALHRAADLRRDAERASAPGGRCPGMKTDSMCLPSASRSRNFVVPSVGSFLPSTTAGVMTQELGGQLRPEVAAEVGHQREIGDAALVDPLEDLARMETRMPEIARAPARARPARFPRCRFGCRMDMMQVGGRSRLTRVNSQLYYVGRGIRPKQLGVLNCAVFP